MQIESPGGDRMAQVEFEPAPRLHSGVHRRFEEAVGAAPFRLGAIEREIGVLQQLIGFIAVGRCEGDADADADLYLMVTDHDRRAHDLDKAARQGGHRARLILSDLQHGKFVAADPGQEVGFTQRAAEPLGRDLQQPIPALMAKRIIDHLEAIEVEAEHGNAGATAETAQCACEMLAEMRAVG